MEKVTELEKIMKDHIAKEEAKFVIYDRAFFGDPQLQEKGVVEKTNEMYDILMGTKQVGKLFNNFGGILKWLLIVGAVIVLFKSWWIGLLAVIKESIV